MFFASFLVNQAFVDAGDRVTLGHPEVVRSTFGAAAALVGWSLIGLGIGAVLRRAAGAITTFFVAMVIAPVLLPAVLPEWVENEVVPYVPLAAGQAMYAVGGDDVNPDWMLSPGVGALVLVGWAGLLLGVGATVLYRRDA